MAVKLEKINTSDFDALLEITSNSEVTKYIGDSKPWTPEKTKKFIEYCVADDKKPDNTRDWFTYKITYNGLFAGIIEFKTIDKFIHSMKPHDRAKYKNDVILTIFVNPKLHGQGIAGSAINLLLGEIREKKPRARHLFSMVRVKNTIMQHVMNKEKFTRMYNINIKAEQFVLYNITIPLKK